MIKRIRITNFKSLQDVSVELSPVTVLIGRSGSGKSVLLKLIIGLQKPDAGAVHVHDEDITRLEQSRAPRPSLEVLAQVDRSLGQDSSKGNWHGTRRYYVTRGTDPRRINSRLLADLGPTNTGGRCDGSGFAIAKEAPSFLPHVHYR